VEARELMKSWTHGQTHARTHGHSSDFILCPMLCTALDRQKYCVRSMMNCKCREVAEVQEKCESSLPISGFSTVCSGCLYGNNRSSS